VACQFSPSLTHLLSVAAANQRVIQLTAVNPFPFLHVTVRGTATLRLSQLRAVNLSRPVHGAGQWATAALAINDVKIQIPPAPSDLSEALYFKAFVNTL
jgi:hypothetical protein